MLLFLDINMHISKFYFKFITSSIRYLISICMSLKLYVKINERKAKMNKERNELPYVFFFLYILY